MSTTTQQDCFSILHTYILQRVRDKVKGVSSEYLQHPLVKSCCEFASKDMELIDTCISLVVAMYTEDFPDQHHIHNATESVILSMLDKTPNETPSLQPLKWLSHLINATTTSELAHLHKFLFDSVVWTRVFIHCSKLDPDIFVLLLPEKTVPETLWRAFVGMVTALSESNQHTKFDNLFKSLYANFDLSSYLRKLPAHLRPMWIRLVVEYPVFVGTPVALSNIISSSDGIDSGVVDVIFPSVCNLWYSQINGNKELASKICVMLMQVPQLVEPILVRVKQKIISLFKEIVETKNQINDSPMNAVCDQIRVERIATLTDIVQRLLFIPAMVTSNDYSDFVVPLELYISQLLCDRTRSLLAKEIISEHLNHLHSMVVDLIPSLGVAFHSPFVEHQQPLFQLTADADGICLHCLNLLHLSLKRNFLLPNSPFGMNRICYLINRNEIIGSSMQLLNSASFSLDEIAITFQGEEAAQGDGLIREWLYLLGSELFDPDFGLWKSVPEGDPRVVTLCTGAELLRNSNFVPKLKSIIGSSPSRAVLLYQLCGMVVVLALRYDARLKYGPPGYLIRSCNVKNYLSLDAVNEENPSMYNALVCIANMKSDEIGSIVEQFYETYNIPMPQKFVGVKINSLNRLQWIESVVDFVIHHRCAMHRDKFIMGMQRAFLSVEKRDVEEISFNYFTSTDIVDLLTGPIRVEWRQLKKICRVDNTFKDTADMFWQVISEFSEMQLRHLWEFWSGSSRFPAYLDSLPQHEHPSITPMIVDGGNADDYLPSSHTCYQQLCVPRYTSVDVMRKQLTYIVNNTVLCQHFHLE